MIQTEFDFRSPEEIAEQKKKAEENEKVFEAILSENPYFYNKYIDFLLSVVPFRWGWRAMRWPSEIRWWAKCKYQKIRYGVSDDDVYSLGHTIAVFILPRLKYFKKKGKIGVPCRFLPDNFHTLQGEAYELAVEKGAKEMEAALDEMIFAFEYIINADDFCELPEILYFRGKDFCFNNEKTKEQEQAWEEYMKKSDALNERKNNGLALFAKYYDTLWI
jgi:hypothetical protein